MQEIIVEEGAHVKAGDRILVLSNDNLDLQILNSEAEYRQTLHEVEAEMARAVQDRDGAMAALRQADRRAKAQQEAYAINSKKFEQGRISPLELKTSSDNHLNAQAEHLNAQLKYFIKSCVVRYYNGISYIEQMEF